MHYHSLLINWLNDHGWISKLGTFCVCVIQVRAVAQTLMGWKNCVGIWNDLLQPSSSVSGCARGEFANKPFVINTLISSKYQTHKIVLTRTLNLLGHNCEDLSSVGFRKCWEVSTEQWSRGQGTRFWATICFTRTHKFLWVVEPVRMPAFPWREGSWILLSQGS